jgi:hypothetical protein
VVGTRTGSLSITSSGAGSPQTLNLSGTGAQPSLGLSSSTLTYTNQATNTTSAGQTVTLTANNGAISGISIAAATGDFSRTTTCAATLAQNATCTITTTFTPTVVGTRTGAIAITSSGTGSPQSISLSGSGVLPLSLGVTSSSLTFASQPLNITSGGQAVTLTANNGSITGISISAATGDFNQTNTCPSTLAQNATCTVTATFTPTAIGTRTGAITITSSGSGSPQTISLTGTGQDPLLLLPGPLTFSQVVGTQSVPQNLTFFNLSGATLNVTNVSVTGAYAQTNNCGTLANNTTCTIAVSFTATAAGTSNGVFTIVTSLGTRTLALSGTVVDFTLTMGRPTRPSRSITPGTVIEAGQAARFDVQLSASAPTNQVVALECTGAPRGAVCRVEPSRVTLNSTVPVTVIVQTSPNSGRSSRLGGNSTGTPSGNYALHLNAHMAGQTRTADLPLQVKAQR